MNDVSNFKFHRPKLTCSILLTKRPYTVNFYSTGSNRPIFHNIFESICMKIPYLKSSDALIPTIKRNKKEWKSCLKCPQNGEKVMMDLHWRSNLCASLHANCNKQRATTKCFHITKTLRKCLQISRPQSPFFPGCCLLCGSNSMDEGTMVLFINAASTWLCSV